MLIPKVPASHAKSCQETVTELERSKEEPLDMLQGVELNVPKIKICR